ncbi:diphthamide synthesis protein [Candidatus Woesearchaeota archaeon]|nr:diphthamide synthesis protein [Candidatus Woesearchaeota archaeon]
MKTSYIEARSSLGKIDFETGALPKKLGIVTTIQHLHDMKKVVDFLWKKDIKAVVAGQVLGCDASAADKVRDDVDAFLYVGSGEFHPIAVALRTGKPVFVLDPGTMEVTKLGTAEVDRIRKRRKGMLVKFHSSDTVGVLMTTKKGQRTVQGGMDKVKEIEKHYPGKTFYYFLCETLDYSQLDNFPFIGCWLNTMCPRMMEDIRVLNIEDL